MNRRRAHGFVLVSLALSGFAVVASCTFPEVDFAASSSEAGSSEGGKDSGASTDGSSATDVTVAVIEASTRGDADTRIDAAGCTSCDCDGDGFFRRGVGCDGGPGPVYDCDDDDIYIKPSRDFASDTTWTSPYPLTFDWNCSGVVERAYPTDFKCGGTFLTGCTGGQAYMGAGPSCGNAADFFECKLVNGVCTTVKVDTRSQGCK